MDNVLNPTGDPGTAGIGMLGGMLGMAGMTQSGSMAEVKSGKPEFKLLPTGTVWIRYKGYLVYIVRESSEKRSIDGMREDFIDVTILRGDLEIVKDLINTAMEYSINLNKDKTKIYSLEPHSQFWECISIQPKRSIESVILDSNIGQKVIEDVDNFINGKQWYINTGVPYRRGYLLFGPPGTGKTSYILSVAGKFGMSISIMNMSKGIHDGNIHSIIQKTPKETILVLEDIDAAFIERKGKNDVLTFSGLLNALDGLASSDGRILIMTTNHIERLSPSLIRPGRIDIKVKFDYASEVSTAQLQGWFIIHRDDPSQLLLTIDDFLVQCERETNSSSSSAKSENTVEVLSPRTMGNGIAALKSIALHGSPDEVHLLSEADQSSPSSLNDSDQETNLRRRSYVPTMISD
ncbi:AAA ATPase domain-containing protein [Heterostelium album PN500]|uniref:AAA ATPase domain-containing protein n=1 Tax=Heterostelium pallidum (strain ATCC 26659 / Pp 5 / PN500) TaxID=670386 RepID=D3BMP1_HETP5|nr:AAA ATPase domain-containing protein [Heterostelium album PN500]EFA77253.1 AAA ATPase domain-containing protein [Heterostelium album PN500]|eukprot:XP_020429382.1 AAA ATPase domain-containing protein [Heterostelium album PN500]